MHYVLDDNNNKVEAYSKEEILAVLQQAINDGTLAGISANAGFVSKVKCCVSGITYREAYVTQATYNQLVAQSLLQPNTIYTITDDTTADDLDDAIDDLEVDTTALEQRLTALEEQEYEDITTITSNLNDGTIKPKAAKSLQNLTSLTISSNKATITETGLYMVSAKATHMSDRVVVGLLDISSLYNDVFSYTGLTDAGSEYYFRYLATNQYIGGNASDLQLLQVLQLAKY